MTTIDSREMRARVLARFERADAEAGDWQRVLSADGARRLLALIVGLSPRSVGELVELAGRAQPNVSRSLASLVRAGLVELRQSGRSSTPVATALGVEKSAALDLVPADVRPGVRDEPSTAAHVSVRVDDPDATADRVRGELRVSIPVKEASPIVGRTRGDLTSLAERWATDWWRILCRRDDPYPLCDLRVEHQGETAAVTALLLSRGGRVELFARSHADGEPVDRNALRTTATGFERELERGVLMPVAEELSARGEHDRPLHDLLARLAEVRGDAGDLAFRRTAGALGLVAADLGRDVETLVAKLVEDMPDEETRLEYASSFLLDELADANAWVGRELAANRGRNGLAGLADVAREVRAAASLAGLRPYERGLALAKRVRRQLRLPPDRPVGGMQGLAALFGAPDYATSVEAPGQLLGFRATVGDAPTVVVGRRDGDAPVFVLARGIGDDLAFGDGAAPISDLYSDRQAVGRAFAAELLAPAEAVVAMIEEGRGLQRVARHFGTNTLVVRHQFGNNSVRRN